jgi:uncharacterized protein
MHFDRDACGRYNARSMLDRLPEFVDPRRLAEHGRALKGEIALRLMSRLRPLLADVDGAVTVHLSFELDELARPRVLVTVRAELTLQCQRCMGPVVVVVDSSTTLGIVETEQEATRLPEGYEPLVVNYEPVSVATLVEDELLLSLPIVPMHPLNQCPTTGWVRRQDLPVGHPEDSPFAVLATLKGGKSGDR